MNQSTITWFAHLLPSKKTFLWKFKLVGRNATRAQLWDDLNG